MSYNLSAVPKLQFFDNDGNPLVSGKLYTYAAGTTTPLATYTDSTGATPNTNPVILDSRGEANVWLAAQSYKFVLKTSTDSTIWTVDNVSNAINVSQILANSGTAGAPPYSFSADTDTGVYLAAVGQLGLTAGGVPFLRGTSTAMTFGQVGGANDVDVTHYGDTTQTGNFTLTGDVNVTGAAVFNEAGADKDFRVEGDTDANLLFVDASTDRVGIGTNTPTEKLHVYGAANVFDLIESSSATGVAVATAYKTANRRWEVGQSPGLGNNNYTIYDATAAAVRVSIDTTGNLGIGTSSPLSILHAKSSTGIIISETTAARNSNNNFLSFRDATGEAGYVGYGAGGANFYTWNNLNAALLFGTNNVTRAQIGADGSQSSVIPGGSTLYPQFACRAWINFDGTSGSIGTGRGSGNVSGVTDNGTGDYTINFTTAMPDANYAVTGVAKEYDSATNSTVVFYLAEQTVANTLSTSFVRVHTATGGASTATDAVVVCVAVFR